MRPAGRLIWSRFLAYAFEVQSNALTYDMENRMVQAENATSCPIGTQCTRLYNPLERRQQALTEECCAIPYASNSSPGFHCTTLTLGSTRAASS